MKCYLCGVGRVVSNNTCNSCYTHKQAYEKTAKEKGWDLDDETLKVFIAAYVLGEKEGMLVQCTHCEQDFYIDKQDKPIKDEENWFCDAQCQGEHWDEADKCSEEEFLIDGVGFADPGGDSALRAATADNPRNLPCPSCEAPNVLTPADRARGYQCDRCADAAEMGGP